MMYLLHIVQSICAITGFAGLGYTLLTDVDPCASRQHSCPEESRCRSLNGSYYCLCPGQSNIAASPGKEMFGWGDSCYTVIYSSKKSWEVARRVCQKQLGDLVVIESKDEQEWLYTQLQRIGLKLACDASWSYLYGLHVQWPNNTYQWQWVDGEQLKQSVVSWSPNQPGDRYSQLCAEIGSGGQLDSVRCQFERPFICKHNITIGDCTANVTCHAQATCVNTLEGYRCKCNAGYSGDGITCTDVDECSNNLHICGDVTRCTNVNGSYYCICPGHADSESSLVRSAGNATLGWGDSCYSIIDSTTKSWEDARRACQAQFGDLVVIKSKAQQEWLYAQIERVAFMSVCGGGWWYGLHSIATNFDFHWQWIDGTEFNKSIENWSEGEPNNPFSEFCVELGDDGMLNNVPCSDPRRYICEIFTATGNCRDNNTCDIHATCTNNPGGGHTCTCNQGFTGNGVKCTDVDECSTGEDTCRSMASCRNTYGSYYCLCPGRSDTESRGIETIAWRNKCYSIHYSSAKSWNDARESCQSQYGDLVVISRATEQDWLFAQLQRISSRLSCNGSWRYWYGIRRNHVLSDFKWVDGSPLNTSIVGWNEGGPNTGFVDDCAEMENSGTLNNLKCQSERPYVCATAGAIPDGKCSVNLVCDLQAYCTDSLEGRKCICNTGYSGDGATCADVDECTNNLNNCGHMDGCRNTNGSYYCVCPGKVNTAHSSGNTSFGWGNSCYTILHSEMDSWADARHICQKLKGDLVVIDSKAEQHWLLLQIQRVASLSPCGGGWWYGLSVSTNDSKWYWVDGSLMDNHIVSWHREEPDNFDTEKCAEVIYDGSMDSFSCSQERPYICERKTQIDECTKGAAKCDINAVCHNSPGSYSCECKAGYTGDGITCSEIRSGQGRSIGPWTYVSITLGCCFAGTLIAGTLFAVARYRRRARYRTVDTDPLVELDAGRLTGHENELENCVD